MTRQLEPWQLRSLFLLVACCSQEAIGALGVSAFNMVVAGQFRRLYPPPLCTGAKIVIWIAIDCRTAVDGLGM